MEEGWIRLHRKTRDHWIWPHKRPYSKFEAWMDILLSANHKAGKVNIGFNVIVVDRGQYLTSQVRLAKKWLWNRETVKNFLRLLEREEMASIQTSKQASTGYTLITVRNYDKHQSLETEQSSIESSKSKLPEVMA